MWQEACIEMMTDSRYFYDEKAFFSWAHCMVMRQHAHYLQRNISNRKPHVKWTDVTSHPINIRVDTNLKRTEEAEVLAQIHAYAKEFLGKAWHILLLKAVETPSKIIAEHFQTTVARVDDIAYSARKRLQKQFAHLL